LEAWETANGLIEVSMTHFMRSPKVKLL
jgi:hypothetical protein